MEPNTLMNELELGVSSMDASHQELLHQMEHIESVPDDEFAEFYVSLVAKIERDFRAEELLMEDLEYAGLKTHREQHARVLGGLHHVAPRVAEGDIAIGRQALELVPHWFIFHIATMDRSLAEAVRKAEQARMPVTEYPGA
jgi:hemerythrin-like metal-binding protein